jgi:hypothetical protein
VRSGPGEARTILLLHIISVRPSKQPPPPSLQWCLGLLAVERMWARWSSGKGEYLKDGYIAKGSFLFL